jgi:hypothetical protein
MLLAILVVAEGSSGSAKKRLEYAVQATFQR